MDRTQYAAINDLETVASEIMKLGGGRFALIFDPKLGWCATDEIELTPRPGAGQTLEVKASCYEDWFKPHMANAVSALGAVRFLGESSMDKLFRKAVPVKKAAETDTGVQQAAMKKPPAPAEKTKDGGERKSAADGKGK